jgi:hypothetical protein
VSTQVPEPDLHEHELDALSTDAALAFAQARLDSLRAAPAADT